MLLANKNEVTATNITETTAVCSGEVTSDAGYTVTERGFCWSSTGPPTTSSSKLIVAGTTGPFSGTITGLTLNTMYYLRAYAINSQGTGFSSQITFYSAFNLNLNLNAWYLFRV